MIRASLSFVMEVRGNSTEIVQSSFGGIMSLLKHRLYQLGDPYSKAISWFGGANTGTTGNRMFN